MVPVDVLHEAREQVRPAVMAPAKSLPTPQLSVAQAVEETTFGQLLTSLFALHDAHDRRTTAHSRDPAGDAAVTRSDS